MTGNTFTAEDFEEAEKLEKEAEEAEKGKKADEPVVDPKDGEREKTPEVVTKDDFKFGDDAPEEMRGKTVAEVEQQYKAMEDAGRLLAAQTTQLLETQKPPEIPEIPTITADDVVAEDGRISDKLSQLFDAKLHPYIQQQNQLAEVNLRNEAYRTFPDLADYPEEVQQMLARTTPEQRLDPRTWSVIHSQIQNSHLLEIADKRRKITEKPAAPHSETGGPPVQGDKPLQLSAEEKSVAKGLQISEKDYASMKQRMQS